MTRVLIEVSDLAVGEFPKTFNSLLVESNKKSMMVLGLHIKAEKAKAKDKIGYKIWLNYLSNFTI